MGASRKLQGEIDRVLKRVQEGVDVFDSIWNKVYDTDNANQKEKFEADLKKEIKKLQRYRDQIKTWIQSSEIKDKKVSASYEQALMDARKQIEREMERFKICEKETKTKAFSKEGLGQQPKTDPKEKAKSETRDWLNNVVSELENQIDNFEAELEGLSVKKGKPRPLRLTHLETSITRHKAHIMKLEYILRLLDNDELSPEQVNDVKDFLDDYVERNQDDFDEFSDVDDLYSSLPLDKVESLEDLVTVGPPGVVKGVSTSSAGLSMKTSLAAAPSLTPATTMPAVQQVSSAHEQVDESASQDDAVARTAPPKSAALSISTSQPPAVGHATPVPSTGVSSPIAVSSAMKEEEIMSFPGRKSSPVLAEAGRTMSKGGLSSQPTSTILPGSGGTISSNVSLGTIPLASETEKKNILDRPGSSGMTQSLVSPLSNRVILPQAAKTTEALGLSDTGSVSDSATMGNRVFGSPVVPSMQWRPGSSYQNPNEPQFRGRTEIAHDQREKYLQRFQQVQQQGQTNLHGMPSLSGGKQFSAQQQSLLLQQFNAQSSSLSPHLGLGIGVQASGLNSATASTSLQQQQSLVHQPSSQQSITSPASKDVETVPTKAEELLQQQPLADDSPEDSVSNSGVGKTLMQEDELKASSTLDTAATVVTGTFTEPAQVTREIDLSPGQPLQSASSSGSLGVIGRRSALDLGAIGDNVSPSSTGSSGGVHDQLYNLQMLEAAFFKLPQSKDSERAKSYSPRHPAVTPPSYPQVQAPIVNNPAFWERLGADTYGTDTLFFSFYYQPNTYQQYLAAKELKKQSWRYHKKYNTWFQRHEEPKVATEEFEQGTYVYFDFHIASEEQHGWCQRIKTEFTFEYSYLEDDLII